MFAGDYFAEPFFGGTPLEAGFIPMFFLDGIASVTAYLDGTGRVSTILQD